MRKKFLGIIPALDCVPAFVLQAAPSALVAYGLLATLASGAHAQTFGPWGPDIGVGPGWNASIAVSPLGGNWVEVHNQGTGAGPLMYQAGQTSGNGPVWGYDYQYGTGYNPAVAVNGSTVVEVHNAQAAAGTLYYTVGQVNGYTISWGPTRQYDVGYNPQIAMVGNYLVEVHNGGGSAGTQWSHIGLLVGNAIYWAGAKPYDYGWNPAVAALPIYNSSDQLTGMTVFEVHNGQGSAGPMWSKVGSFTGFGSLNINSAVQWDNSENYDWGWNPKVAAGIGASFLVEVHDGQSGAGPLWYHQTYWGGLSQVVWGNSYEYDTGINPAVAAFQFGATEAHNNTSSSYNVIVDKYAPYHIIP